MSVNEVNLDADIINCWFCKNIAQQESIADAKMYNGYRENDIYHYTNLNIEVQRCGKCKFFHDIINKVETFSGVTGLLIGGIIGLAAAIFIFFGALSSGIILISITLLIIMTVVGAIIGFLCGFLIIAILLLPVRIWMKIVGIKDWNYVEKHPKVRQMWYKGWRMGEKPPRFLGT